jgi:hypothetical protein
MGKNLVGGKMRKNNGWNVKIIPDIPPESFMRAEKRFGSYRNIVNRAVPVCDLLPETSVLIIFRK